MFIGTIAKDLFQKLFIAFLSFLPDSPVSGFLNNISLNVTWHKIMSFVNYFIPIHTLNLMLGVWIIGITTFQIFTLASKYISLKDLFHIE